MGGRGGGDGGSSKRGGGGGGGGVRNPLPTMIWTDHIIFLSPITDIIRMPATRRFIPCTAKLWNSVLAKWFPLICNLNHFSSRVNRDLASLGFYWSPFLCTFPQIYTVATKRQHKGCTIIIFPLKWVLSP